MKQVFIALILTVSIITSETSAKVSPALKSKYSQIANWGDEDSSKCHGYWPGLEKKTLFKVAMANNATADLHDMTFHRPDWYSACYNYYNGQFYDYYETKYNNSVNATMTKIMNNMALRLAAAPAANSTASNGNSSNSTNSTDGERATGWVMPILTPEILMNEIEMERMNDTKIHNKTITEEKEMEKKKENATNAIPDFPRYIRMNDTHMYDTRMNMTVKFNHTNTSNRTKIDYSDKNTYALHISDEINFSFKQTEDLKFTQIIAKFRDYFNYAMHEQLAPLEGQGDQDCMMSCGSDKTEDMCCAQVETFDKVGNLEYTSYECMNSASIDLSSGVWIADNYFSYKCNVGAWETGKSGRSFNFKLGDKGFGSRASKLHVAGSFAIFLGLMTVSNQ